MFENREPAAFSYPDAVRAMVLKGGPDIEDYAYLDAVLRSVHLERSTPTAVVQQALQRTLADVLSADTMQGFALRKPHGYAGDFEMIDRIYNRRVCSDTRYAKWDLFFHEQAASKAVCNRKTYFHALLNKLAQGQVPARVLKVGTGPGRSMFEWMNNNRQSQVSFDCVEIDGNAIEYARVLNGEHLARVRFIHRNALRFQSDTQYELIWSAGLFDYFSDAVFKSLLKRLLKSVKPGGELVIGNFADGNPSQGYMELVGDWHLRHRSSAHLIELARECDVDSSMLRVGKEPVGVNLFLHVSV